MGDSGIRKGEKSIKMWMAPTRRVLLTNFNPNFGLKCDGKTGAGQTKEWEDAGLNRRPRGGFQASSQRPTGLEDKDNTEVAHNICIRRERVWRAKRGAIEEGRRETNRNELGSTCLIQAEARREQRGRDQRWREGAAAARRGVGDSEERRRDGEERGVMARKDVGERRKSPLSVVAVHDELDVVDDELDDGTATTVSGILFTPSTISSIPDGTRRPTFEPDTCGVLIPPTPAAPVSRAPTPAGFGPCAVPLPRRPPRPSGTQPLAYARGARVGYASSNDPGSHYPIRAMKERRDEEEWRKMRRFGLVFGLGEKSGIFESKTSRKNKINPGGKPVTPAGGLGEDGTKGRKKDAEVLVFSLGVSRKFLDLAFNPDFKHQSHPTTFQLISYLSPTNTLYQIVRFHQIGIQKRSAIVERFLERLHPFSTISKPVRAKCAWTQHGPSQLEVCAIRAKERGPKNIINIARLGDLKLWNIVKQQAEIGVDFNHVEYHTATDIRRFDRPKAEIPLFDGCIGHMGVQCLLSKAWKE
ncbi:hypothetical protein DFH06DRAFT_1410385 [Mycena polygramma]|nr:hypothetical protein DFH06DRAFT_1410385 [Mycena polygramma]